MHELIRAAHGLGFEMVSGMVAFDQPDGSTRFDTVHNTPAGYVAVYSDPAYGRKDPVMQHCKLRGDPVVWDQSTYAQGGAIQKWETQAEFGYRCGIALAMHLPGGRHFFMGVDRAQPLPASGVSRKHVLSEFVLIALYAQEVSWRAMLNLADGKKADVKLTPREAEVLRWTAVGKTAWEVGMVLGISERTAAIHANRATHKLGCANKHQASLRALHCGLI